MPATVSVLVTFESSDMESSQGSLWLALADLCRASGIEATFTLDGNRVKQFLQDAGRLCAVLRTQNVALRTAPTAYLADLSWKEGARAFREREHDSFLAVSQLGAALPTSLTPCGWAPQTLPVASDWGTRSYIVPSSFYENGSRPYFVGARLHLSNLGASWIDVPANAWASAAGLDPLGPLIERQAASFGQSAGVVVVRLFPDQLPDLSSKGCSAAVESFSKLLTRLRGVESIMLQSSRQVVDRFADISYDQAISADFFRASAEKISAGELGPIEYDLGFLAPSEQLYGLAKIWLGSIEKGKPVRNTTIRTPHGPEAVEPTSTSVQGVPANELPGVLAEVCKAGDDTGQLPASFALQSGKISPVDLLPTLAAGFAKGEVVDLPIKCGHIREEPLSASAIKKTAGDAGLSESAVARWVELARCQLWTYKPVLGL